MNKGTINVQSDNIFPIIKKFLYSEHDIFLRELVSNAVDATQKLKTLVQKGELTEEIKFEDLAVEVVIDKENKQLRISDQGVGMTAEEVERYINQIAFSGAREFLEKYKDDAATIIGHFGLGFYSAFMVADLVEIQTKSWQEDALPVHWKCAGNPEYEMQTGTRSTRGTDIILHLNEDSQEFLDPVHIKNLLQKYCKFLPVTIRFEDKTINNTQPAWTKKPSELTDEDYKNFYKELYPNSLDEPLFWIHLNVDFPFKLTGILYFPKFRNNFEVKKDKIGLYCNQVFVTDNVENIVPDYLTLLHGVIDSPDIPLNVSRSYLQGDRRVKQISEHISKKVAAKLEEIFKNKREEFEQKWDYLAVFVKYGMLSDEKFAEKAKKFALLENIADKYFTIEEYTEHIKAAQTDKNGKVVALYTSNRSEQDAYIQAATEKDYDVLLMENVIDTHFVAYLDQSDDNLVLKRVDADIVEQLIEKDETPETILNEAQQNIVKDVFGKLLGENTMAQVEIKAMLPTASPIIIVKPEFMRRMRDMSMYNGTDPQFMMPETYQVVVNGNHPLINKMLLQDDTKQRDIAQQLYDLALLQQNMLKGTALTNFIKRSVGLVG
ncbi:MAG: molecular chaperone HtpG [Chitinophagales bacterium]|nr:molecular chaperone HtpG [Bacteroidota bacterium]MCB9043082.1 molecular chaperone HtpG [Chitinophagales bacterium]